ncbi:SCO1860 family LAETG-anchored protein [Streptomyces sp. P9(2023)]|uniref:SCO1860 family LAETG-anchored protein n=1 Tax=Streptomyces sp. P9(2023) TaxID=3064394 RepID=UPI0028F3F1A6|nr:SCO1860 family LAETG-anchored protein [Streptomyces sp. P9(2023)]MDT9691691.1 SCO1860 family LAETG-anchored protein [Streptomyces sp. P9(2023)]
MNSNTFRLPVRRTAAAATVAALAVGPVVLLAPAAHATGGEGRATAVVLRTGLDVSLLDKSVNVPLRASLNEVKAPESENKTALTVKVEGAENGKPIDVLRADVATSKATVEKNKAEGYVNLVKAQVHVPGVPLLSLIEVQKVTSKAVCETGKQPVAESNVLGHITVLGQKTTLSTGGRTKVSVPGVGDVTLDLSRTSTTSRTAAATALELKVEVNPLKLGVAEVNGVVTLAEATCETPKGTKPTEKPTEQPTDKPTEQPSEQPSQEPSAKPTDAGGVKTQNEGADPTDQNLAATGGSSMTPYLAGGAIVLLGGGAGALVLARSRARG